LLGRSPAADGSLPARSPRYTVTLAQAAWPRPPAPRP